MAGALLERFNREVPTLGDGEDPATILSTATEHITAWLDVLEHGFDVTEVKAPPAAVQFARRFAQRGGEPSELLHAYRIGLAGMVQWTLEGVARLAKDPELMSAAAIQVCAMGFEFNDRMSKEVVATYQEERDRRLQWRLSVINKATASVGTTLDLTQTAQELADACTDYFADLATVDLLDSVLEGEDEGTDPGPDRSALRRIAQKSVLEGCPDSPIGPGETHSYPGASEPAHVLNTGRASLLRFTATHAPAWLAPNPDQGRAPRTYGVHSMLVVPLRARGRTLGLLQCFRHRTEAPFEDDDLDLAEEIASRAAVYIDNARQYTHQRSTALTLQRSLLPHHVPEQPAVETASRYLPSGSRAGVGGDWYDVIPLSGARVALVVGDVIGHGLHASATMGRLRTAVRTLADIDLPPDELLTHLDDVVIRFQREQEGDADEISATCLYAVYDPVSRVCALASAGHLVPAVVSPPGNGSGSSEVAFPEVPIGPPLGLGGLPFETAELELPEGSILALYTDGLIEDRVRDSDTGLAVMREVLARPAASLEDTCDRLLGTLLTSRPSDDIALLLARTQALDSGHVATWDLPSDPAVVRDARAYATDQLAAWGLDEAAFTTELIVSELVTNAIRYGKEPIQLRMIHQATLTCEVSDASSTAPHLRRARTFDEGGRGLLLVAQLADRWGARHTREGKVIWAEQPLGGEMNFEFDL
ncbi:SpoIIE family protein phosphatase [Streptomyces tanashiensis]|uniref:ATP-binding SpoIIE family protein phosphatase n=1 Tax=Streptomyces tanashiensis TaxID=67367 RepID=UPI0036F019B9